MSFFSKQFIDVIHWTEPGEGILAYRYPMEDMEIQNGGQLTVRDSQAAIFVNEGQIADVFGPGLYTLTTQTLPILTYLRNWDKAFKSPFKSDVYYYSMRLQTDVRRTVGVVFQTQSLDKALTVEENLRAQGHLHGLSGATLRERMANAMQRLGLEDRRKDLVDTLSGGLRRRVEIAKALLHKPKVLLMDEASTGLDPAEPRSLGFHDLA